MLAAALALWTVVHAVRVLAAGVERAAHGAVAPVARHWIDPNRSTLPELRLLPGIGPERAEAIVLERVRSGPFRDSDELVRVPGIGPETVRRLRRWLAPRAR